MTTRPNRTRRPTRRPRRDTEPLSRSVIKALLVVGFVAALVWLSVSSINGVPGRHYRTMYVSTAAIGNLIAHDPVRIGGVRVGQVGARTIGADGDPRVELRLDPGTRVPADTAVAVRAAGLLGARYIELVPGHSAQALDDGATIRGTANSLTFGVSEALDTFDDRTRRSLRTAIRELGTGLTGNGTKLNDAIRDGSTYIKPAEGVINTLLARPTTLQRLLPSLNGAFAPLDRNRAQIAGAITPFNDTLRAIVAERGALRDTLTAAPGTLQQADSGLQAGRRLLAATRSLAVSAHATLPAAPGALRATAALLRESPTPLKRARGLLDDAQQTVPGVLRVTRPLSPVLPAVVRGLGDLTPIVDQLGRYGCNIVNTGIVFRSMTGFGGTGDGPTGNAQAFRLQALVSPTGENAGIAAPGGILNRRVGYGPPCSNLATPYHPVLLPKVAGK
jgi:virulence factor Mce-like protein